MTRPAHLTQHQWNVILDFFFKRLRTGDNSTGTFVIRL